MNATTDFERGIWQAAFALAAARGGRSVWPPARDVANEAVDLYRETEPAWAPTIGQRVQVCRHDENNNGHPVGSIGTVVDIEDIDESSMPYFVEVDGHGLFQEAAELKPEPAPSAGPFVVGQRVRVCSFTVYRDGHGVGSLGTVVEVDECDDNMPYLVDVDGGALWQGEDELEAVADGDRS